MTLRSIVYFELKRVSGVPTMYRGTAAEVRALNSYIKVVRAAESLAGRVREQIAGFGLTEPQFAVLEALYHLGPLRASDLAKKLLRSGANVTTVIDNLEKRALVARRACTNDRRVTYVDITPGGRDQVKRMFPAIAGRITGLMSALEPSEQEELGRLARKLGLASTT
jgi:MarR family 2-MHQ and catechol resistance regulon transcriptional repressor